jgi:D-glycero-D-manno-heptose 1,7-bisphosphate phosphatase
VCVTTNQGGIGLGFYSEDFVRRLHDELSVVIDAAGAHVDGWYYCPHHPLAVIESLRVECDCRKPRPGMIRQAAREFEIDLARSFVVGDKSADIGLATAVGARGILVRTGYGEAELQRHGGGMPDAAHVAQTAMDAAAWILREAGFPREAL